ncbi:MAG: rod shape-determining protein RodA, partial [Bacteroidales bacterium]|nr:rod shape-determining protein RodA [Bacteroidales bacterium]
AYLFYIQSIVLLVGVLIFGTEISGAKAWIKLGPVSLQPAEFAKFTTCLAFAKYVSRPDLNMRRISNQITASLWFLLPVGLILLEPDAGSALVFTAFIFVLYREGMSGNVLITGVIAVLLFILALLVNPYILMGLVAVVCTILVFINKRTFKNIAMAVGIFLACCVFIRGVDYAFNRLSDHQRSRINVLLGIDADLKGAGYNVNQSKIAIGSGGFSGKGFLDGTQTKFNFVPEQSTDFIFCTIGEEWGWIGSTVLLGLFLFLLIRIILLAEKQKNDFGRIYGYGLACILFIHVFVNIGMTIGLLPVIGIPLPFFSYGGSSLWTFTLLLFVFIKMDGQRHLSV